MPNELGKRAKTKPRQLPVDLEVNACQFMKTFTASGAHSRLDSGTLDQVAMLVAE